MKKVFIIFNIFLLVFGTFSSSFKVSTCPGQCNCDVFNNLKRVSCMDKNLLDIVSVPKEVNVLIMRGNVIKRLEDLSFRNAYGQFYTNLLELDLSENSISDIDMHTFQQLKQLENLYLSRNRLEIIYPMVFVANIQLRELDLSYNNFRHLNDEPFIQHKTLKILNLSNTQIVQLYPSTFSELPMLEDLNLSGNNMIKLAIVVLQPLTHLRALSLNDNNWRCSLFDNLQNWLIFRKISFDRQCMNVKKSEKMIEMFPDIERTEEDLTELWKLEDKTKIYDKNKMKKPTLSDVYYIGKRNSFVDDFNARFPSLWSLIIGIQVGLLLGMFITYFWINNLCCCCRGWKRRRTIELTSRRGENCRVFRRRHLLLNNTQGPHTDTPPIVRRQMSTDAFLRSHSWEATPITEQTLNRLILRDANEMNNIPRSETPPPPYSDCTNQLNITESRNLENDTAETQQQNTNSTEINT